MASLRRLRIATRLNLLVTLFVVALAVLGGVGVVQLSRAAQAQGDISRIAALRSHAQDVVRDFADVNGWQNAYAFSVATDGPSGAADTATNRAAFLDVVRHAHTDLATMRTILAGHDGWLTSQASAEQSLQKFMDLDATIAGLYRSGVKRDAAHANDLVNVDEVRIYDAGAKTVSGLADALATEQARVVTASAAESARAQQIMVVAGLVAGVAGVGVALLVSMSIRTPLRRLRARLSDIARGDGDLTQRLDVDGRDELTEICVLFNEFAEQIAGTIREVRDAAGSLAAAAEQLAVTSGSIAAASQQTSAQAATVAEASRSVDASVTGFSAAAGEFGQSITDISRNTTEAAKVAASAVDLARNTTQTVEQLGRSSAEIGSVIEIIESVAGQTNLLALNATIEAARAGDAGRGFAVVATEVKELAGETARATRTIADRIQQIQAETGAAVAAIGEIAVVVGQINDFQGSIAGAVEEQTATAAQMASAVEEAATGTREITRNIDGVADAAGVTDRGVGESRAATGELATMSSRLQELVGRFTV